MSPHLFEEREKEKKKKKKKRKRKKAVVATNLSIQCIHFCGILTSRATLHRDIDYERHASQSPRGAVTASR
jgi:hypothetical protein